MFTSSISDDDGQIESSFDIELVEHIYHEKYATYFELLKRSIRLTV